MPAKVDGRSQRVHCGADPVEDVFGRLARKLRSRGGLIEENYHAHDDAL